MNEIKCVADVSNLIKEKNVKIFGIGGTPITRTEAHHLTDNLEIICSVNATEEIANIRRKVNIKCFPLKNDDGTYTKKPSKILSDQHVQDYINASKEKYSKIAIYIMKADSLLEKICRDNDWILIGNSAAIIEKYNDKELFQKILNKTSLANEAMTIQLNDLHNQIDNIFDKFGEKIVIQLPEVSGGGHGTFFFDKKEKSVMVEQIKERIEIINEKIPEATNIIINSFFSGPTLSILSTITRDNGIVVANPQHQLIDIEDITKTKNDASGIFCGHDWTLPIPQNIKEQSINISQKIGAYLQNEGVLGIFGTDLMWDVERDIVVPIEINARLTGVFPSFVDVQIINGEVPILAFHLLDFLNIQYNIEKSSIYRAGDYKIGTHLIIFNNYPYKVRVVKSELRSGIYSLQRGGMYFERGGFEMSDIRNDDEFVVVDGVPEAGSVYAKNRKLVKIISKKSFGNNSYKLNDWGKKIVANIYNSITCEKYE